MTPMTFAPAELIIRAGDDADNLFFLTKGEVNVTVTLPSGYHKRLATLSPGMAFGEIALINRSTRTANVSSIHEVVCYALSVADYDRLEQNRPNVKVRLLENLARSVMDKLRKANAEITMLSK